MKKFYFRNKTEIAGIEPEALWQYHPETDTFVLVDDDQHVVVPGKERECFYEEER